MLESLSRIPVKRLFVIGFTLVLALKLLFAARLDLYSDEVFYWLASTHPALAYSDLPFLTALLVAVGSAFNEGSAFSVRLIFIVLGSCLPLLVYWVAEPLTDKRRALESAALTLCLPLAAFLGLLAVPDVPLLVLGTLAIGCFERAVRLNAAKFFLATGLVVALGLSTHYRFFLYPLAAFLFLLCFKPARGQWRNPYLWLSMLIASSGLAPIIWFNLNNQLSSASFYLVDRHPWSFQASGLLHVFKQAALVTPPLYALLAFTLWQLLRRARNGAAGPALLLSFALSNLLVYLLLAPWTDATSTSIHWPLSGYIPLLVFVPDAMRELYQIISQRFNATVATRILASIPIIGFLGSMVAFIGVGSQSFQSELQAILGKDVLSNKMAGWQDFARHTSDLIEREYIGDSPVIITDNYYTAAQTEFAGLTTSSYTLDLDKAVNDGRIAQLQLWRKDETGLSDVAGKAALFITEDSTLTVPAKHELMTRLCNHAGDVSYLEELSLFNSDKRFSYYKVRLKDTDALHSSTRFSPCPYPARAWLDSPVDGAVLEGKASLAGWAYNEDIGVAEVYLLIDDVQVERVNYGGTRQDVVEVMGVQSDPQAPALGINHIFDTSKLRNGRHRLALEIKNNQGMVVQYGARDIVVDNPSASD